MMLPDRFTAFLLAVVLHLTILSSTVAAIDLRSLIVGGLSADPDRFPYYARIDYDGDYWCGGTLIRRDFVLTAAHCVYWDDLGLLTATVGAVNHQNTSNTRLVTKILHHPVYHGDSDINDLALLQIEPVSANHPIVQLNSNRSEPIVGDAVTAIGLGKTGNDEPNADELQQVELKVVLDERCDEIYEGDLHRKSMICAWNPNKDSCGGDSGGGLLVLGETPAQDVQVGVVSFGEDCADETVPGVYADVSYMYKWIDSTLCQYSMDPPEGCNNATSSIYIGPNEECRDYPGAFYVGWWYQFQRCEWIKGQVEQYCYRGNEAWIQCPFTCHSCTYERDDDFLFNDNSTKYGKSSSPVILGMLLAVSFVLACIICIWSMRWLRQRRNNRLQTSLSKQAPSNVEIDAEIPNHQESEVVPPTEDETIIS